MWRAKISVAYERGKSLPAWLAEGWQKNGQTLFSTTDDTPLDLYVKEYNRAHRLRGK
jgi:hypothetical protein